MPSPFKILIVLLILSGTLSSAPAKLYFSGSELTLSEITSSAPSQAKRIQVVMMRKGILLNRKTFRLPLAEGNSFALPTIKEAEAWLELNLAFQDSQGKTIESRALSIKLMGQNIEKIITSKVAYYKASALGSSKIASLLKNIKHTQVHSLGRVQADLLLVEGLDLDFKASDVAKLLELAKLGTVVLVLSPKGHLSLPDAKQANISLSGPEVLSEWVENARIPQPDKSHLTAAFTTRSGRPTLNFKKEQQGWSWVQFKTPASSLIFCTIDLASMSSTPEPYLLFKALLQK